MFSSVIISNVNIDIICIVYKAYYIIDPVIRSKQVSSILKELPESLTIQHWPARHILNLKKNYSSIA